MAAWAKMVTTVTVMLLPGGFLFLVAYAGVRAWVARAKALEVQHGGRDRLTPWRALAAVRPADVLREARTLSGLRAPEAGSHTAAPRSAA